MSPQSNDVVAYGDELSIGTEIGENTVVTQLIDKKTERYRMRKFVNDEPTVPPEYKNNGIIYSKTPVVITSVLNENEYDFKIEQIN